MMGENGVGWNVPCPAQDPDENGVMVQITPIQAIMNLTSALNRLTDTVDGEDGLIDVLDEQVEVAEAMLDGKGSAKKRRR